MPSGPEPTQRGVSPVYSRYAQRTAETSAGFLLPHLKPGMSLLDVGCGLGSITLGLARAIAPGNVVGIDIHEDAIGKARELATEQGVRNATFRVGSVYDLPLEGETFEAAFAHMVFMHLEDPVKAGQEVFRVLKPGGLFGLVERAEEGDLRGNSNPTIELAWDLFMKWQVARGSNLRLGAALLPLMRKAGFTSIIASAAYHNSTLSEYILQFSTLFADESVSRMIEDNGWAGHATLEHIRSAIQQWGQDPNTMWKMAVGEAIGWKSE